MIVNDPIQQFIGKSKFERGFAVFKLTAELTGLLLLRKSPSNAIPERRFAVTFDSRISINSLKVVQEHIDLPQNLRAMFQCVWSTLTTNCRDSLPSVSYLFSIISMEGPKRRRRIANSLVTSRSRVNSFGNSAASVIKAAAVAASCSARETKPARAELVEMGSGSIEVLQSKVVRTFDEAKGRDDCQGMRQQGNEG